MTGPVLKLLVAIESTIGCKPTRNGRGWQSRCPAHDDKRPSLSIAEGDDGRALITCHAGCSAEAIVKSIGLTLRDLMPVDALTVDNTPRHGTQRAVLSTLAPAKTPTTYATANAAVTELERRNGPRSAIWTYHDATGEPIGLIVRWDRTDGIKDVRPVARIGTGWIIGGMPAPRPLYQLPALTNASRVYICEGEKAADSVTSLGLVATTSPHGSQSAKTADWSALAGKLCIIWPDHDDAGRRYADDVTNILAELTPNSTIKLLEFSNLRRGDDAVDYVAARRKAGLDDKAIKAEIEGMADAEAPVELEGPSRNFESFRPFPTAVLPEPIRTFVIKGAKAIGCDPSYVALPLLSALASAIGNTRRIQLKRGWTEPAIVWTAIVGDSGTMKTPAFRLSMKPLRDVQTAALKDHVQATADYERAKLDYERELLLWKRNGEGDPPEKPEEPQPARCIVSDVTVEALAPILSANWRGVLLARDELDGWFGSFDRYANAKGSDAAHWLSVFNGESLIVDRKTGPMRTILVPAAAVSITGGIQPVILAHALGSKERESGLAGRLLFAMPPRRTKRWTEADVPPEREAELALLFDRLRELRPDLYGDDDPEPRVVPLTADGKRAWVAFFNEHAAEQTELTGDLAAAWSKLEGYAARFALVFHYLRWAAKDPTLTDIDRVDEASVAAGVALSRWFGCEARRVYGVLAESDEDRD